MGRFLILGPASESREVMRRSGSNSSWLVENAFALESAHDVPDCARWIPPRQAWDVVNASFWAEAERYTFAARRNEREP